MTTCWVHAEGVHRHYLLSSSEPSLGRTPQGVVLRREAVEIGLRTAEVRLGGTDTAPPVLLRKCSRLSEPSPMKMSFFGVPVGPAQGKAAG